MGNNASAEDAPAKKQRNHSIAEFDFLLDPSIGNHVSAKVSAKGGNAYATENNTPANSTSNKIDMLKKAKEKGSFVSKKDILSIGGDNAAVVAEGADGAAVLSQPLRDVPPPASEGDVVHPAKWLWKHPELTLCMDDHGNTYYYNYNTQESTWDPPEDLCLPKAEITFKVKVPSDAKPGQTFTVEINGTPLEVMCPMDISAGMVLELSNDTPLYAASTEDMAGNDPAAGRFAAIPESEDAPQTTSITPAPVELPTSVDDDTLWKALAKVAEVEDYPVKSDAELSRRILTEVANGSYSSELIYRVGWAYKFNLLKGAATACYLCGGSFLDSSLYDNCDGTPRYEKAGFVEWLGDLQAQRVALDEKIKAGALDGEQHSGAEYATLERLTLSGDEARLIEGIVTRRKQVDVDLDNYRSRVLAIVSVDGGPTREALDSVFGLLKGNVQCEEEDEMMDNDEMEEEVSNYIQDRHKFVVDILLTVVLLEEELDTLTQKIEEFERKRAEQKSKAEGAALQGGAEGAVAAREAVVDEEQELLAEQHRAELQRLQAELVAKKEEQMRVLYEKFDRTRALGVWVSDLLASAVQKLSGATEKPVDPSTAAFFEQALQVNQSEEAEIISAKLAAEEARGIQVANETLAANTLILQHERDLKKLKASLEDSQEAQRAALRERLAKKKAARVADLLADESTQLTAEEAEAQAAEEVAKEEEAGKAEIVRSAEEAIAKFSDNSLAEIKKLAESAAERLEDSLNAQKSAQQRALMKRLERKKQACTEAVEREVAAAGPAVSAEQKEVMLIAALAKVDNAAEEEAALLEAENLAGVRAVRAQMVALVRAEHEKECERLENDLLAQKDKRVKDLKSRLERKKAERAKEILSEATTGTSSAVAVALANEEVSAEEKQELAKINNESEAAMEEARKAVLENLVELHTKETARLAEDMKYQEKMQRTNLANRLDRQRKVKERELQVAAVAEAAAQETTVSAEEIKAKVEQEMQALAAQEEQALQQSLQQLKSQQEKESTQLADELVYKKSSADKRLKDRLAQRNQKAAQLDAMRASKATAEKGAQGSSKGGFASSVSVKVKPQTAEAVVEAPPPVPDGSVAAEDFLNGAKEWQKQLLARLDLFVQFEKATVTAQKQALVKAAGSKQKSEAALTDLAKTAILFDHIAEFVALGLKKTLLYENKAIKDFIAKSKAEKGAATSGAHRLSAEEVAILKGRQYAAPSREDATEKILERFQRDISGLLDSQAQERRTSLAEMRTSGSSFSQIQTAAQEMAEYHNEAILAEVEKVAITLSGVWIDPDMLSESAAGGAKEETPATNADSDNEEDEDALHESLKHTKSRADLHRHKQRATFGGRIIQWFTDVLVMLRLYSTTPAAMMFAFDGRCAQLKFLRTSANAHLLDLSSEFRTQVQKPLMVLCVQAFQQHMRPGDVPPGVSLDSAVAAAQKSIQGHFKKAQGSSNSAVDADALFAQTQTLYYDPATGKDALCAELLNAYKTAVTAFLDKPVLTPAELATAKESASKAITPMGTKSGKVSDGEGRKIQLMQAVANGTDRLKMELKEKYKKIGGSEEMQARELEQLMRAQKEVLDMVAQDEIVLDEVNADGLLAVIEKKAQGEEVSAEDVVEVQREVQKQKQQERAQKDVQRVLQNASESENKLGVALKIEQAKRQQALQNRLLNKKKKSE